MPKVYIVNGGTFGQKLTALSHRDRSLCQYCSSAGRFRNLSTPFGPFDGVIIGQFQKAGGQEDASTERSLPHPIKGG